MTKLTIQPQFLCAYDGIIRQSFEVLADSQPLSGVIPNKLQAENRHYRTSKIWMLCSRKTKVSPALRLTNAAAIGDASDMR